MAITDPNLVIEVGPEPTLPGGPATIEVVWSLRDGAWYVRGLSHPDWHRLHHHLPASEGDHALFAAARLSLRPAPGRRVDLRRLPPVYRLPRGEAP